MKKELNANAHHLESKRRMSHSNLDSFVFEVKVDVKKGALRFREKIDNRCASFVQFTFTSMINVIWS